MLYPKGYSMNTFLANFKIFETNSNVSSIKENSWLLFKVRPGKFDLVFISSNSW